MVVKVCGIRHPDEAAACVEHGVDIVGFVFWRGSSRFVTPERARDLAEMVHRTSSARGRKVLVAGVFVHQDPGFVAEVARYVGLDVVQLHGDEDTCYCRRLGRCLGVDPSQRLCHEGGSPKLLKALRVGGEGMDERAVVRDIRLFRDYVNAFLLDAFVPGARGGTGYAFHWPAARGAAEEATVLIAGGLTPFNVAVAIAQARPHGVDASSGLESSGKKDADKIRRFVEAARAAASSLSRMSPLDWR